MIGNVSIRKWKTNKKNKSLYYQDLPSDSDDKGKFGLSWHIIVSNFAGHATKADFTPVHLPVLLVILLSPFVDQLPGHLSCLRQAKKTHVKNCACHEITQNLDTVKSVNRYLFCGQNLLDSNGLHGGEGLSPFQKALRDRWNFFSIADTNTIKTQARKTETVVCVRPHVTDSSKLLLARC